ncbi:uncharacterized protein LOC117331536 isoform X2 [Pecten maximus]|uniref:uncharacterized protein LOC117331536 isoform X2 n=1 Tax=Pecten maximus TaxID=6579 RepID=UPI001458EAF7|nr:uncharacterized protein LOC117331536 isoform X2 [Pecten maximus]
MDVVCFSFDCNIYDDGSSNCTTIDPSLEDGQLLDADTICDLQLEYPQSIFNEERQYVQPTALSSNDNPVLSDAPLDDDIDDTVERAAPVYRDNIMFERTTFGTQRERDTNKDKVV